MEFNAGKSTYETELDIAKESDVRNLKQVEYAGRKQDVTNLLVLDTMRFKQTQELEKREYEIKEKGYTPNVLKSMILDTAKWVYNNQSLRNISIFNLNGGEDNAMGKAVA